jgi:hypothetical protein
MSQTFKQLLNQASELHDKKSHDYASDENPYGNYHFAGKLGQLFQNPDDAGFVARMGEKLYRLANLENNGKIPLNENVADTEIDLVVIMTLWMASRRDRRATSNEAPHEVSMPLL